MNTANTSATFMTNSDKTIGAFATLRFVGDALDPDEISEALKQKPTRAYRVGETYRPGPRSPELIGKTGLWYYSTDRLIPSKDLNDHLDALIRLIAPFADDGKRLRTLREIMERDNLRAHVTCFWRGRSGADKPSIHSAAKEAFDRLPAEIEVDFDIEDES
jgi:Domain of unknown function (DUF4279)